MIHALLIGIFIFFQYPFGGQHTPDPLLFLSGDAPAAASAPTDGPTVQQVVLELVNQERWENGQLPPLKGNPQLYSAADGHSSAMALRDFFAHCDLDTKTSPGDRIQSAGYVPSTWGENIAAGYTSPEAVMDGWMNSSGHRANILRSSFREIGVGYSYQSDDAGNVRYDSNGDCNSDGAGSYGYRSYWTQNFGAQSGVYPLVINREAYQTDSPQVALYLYGQDWAAEMRLRNEDGAWTDWLPFQNNLDWTLSGGGGVKTVSAELRSGGTVLSSSDTILYNANSAALALASPELLFGFYPAAASEQTAWLTIENLGGADLAWTLSAQPQVDWLAIASASGSLAPGESTQVAVTVDRGGLAPGSYAAALVVDGGAAENSPLQVGVSVLVTDQPPLYLPGVRK
jgi:uncharacterized protein YkwD